MEANSFLVTVFLDRTAVQGADLVEELEKFCGVEVRRWSTPEAAKVSLFLVSISTPNLRSTSSDVHTRLNITLQSLHLLHYNSASTNGPMILQLLSTLSCDVPDSHMPRPYRLLSSADSHFTIPESSTPRCSTDLDGDGKHQMVRRPTSLVMKSMGCNQASPGMRPVQTFFKRRQLL